MLSLRIELTKAHLPRVQFGVLTSAVRLTQVTLCFSFTTVRSQKAFTPWRRDGHSFCSVEHVLSVPFRSNQHIMHCSMQRVFRSAFSAQCVLSNRVRLSTYLCFKQLGQTSKLSVQSCSCSAYSAVRRALDVGRWTLPLAALSVPFSLQSRVFRSDNCTTTKYWSMHANGTQSAQSIAAFSCSICAERGATWMEWNTE